MAKLIYSAITSLDGYLADEAGDFGWAAHVRSPPPPTPTTSPLIEAPLGRHVLADAPAQGADRPRRRHLGAQAPPGGEGAGVHPVVALAAVPVGSGGVRCCASIGSGAVVPGSSGAVAITSSSSR